MDGEIYCLMFSKRIDDRIRNVLFTTAQQMAKEGKTKKKIKGAGIEGQVTTKYKTAVLGAIGGFVFHARVETDYVDTEVTYMVRPVDIDIEDYEWIPWTGQGTRIDPSLN